MGTDPQFLTRPRTIGDRRSRAAARGRPDERCTHQAVARRPSESDRGARVRGCRQTRFAVGFARTSPSPLAYWFVAEHSLERVCGLRDRAAQGKAGARA